MAEFHIKDADFASLKGQVIVITGGSSGIGLATANLLLSIGALVVVGDRNPGPAQHENLTFVPTDVTSWSSILALFTTTVSKHSRVDHVFANAGIRTRVSYLTPSLDPVSGTLLEPDHACLSVNLQGCINTVHAGVHFILSTHQVSPAGGSSGSIVCTASASGFQAYSCVDYGTSKHGVIGLVRGLTAEAEKTHVPIRFNALAPSWTATGLLSAEDAQGAGLIVQTAEAVARNVAVFMADPARRGQVVYSAGGRFFEVEEAVLRPATRSFVGEDTDKGFWRLKAWITEKGRREE